MITLGQLLNTFNTWVHHQTSPYNVPRGTLPKYYLTNDMIPDKMT